MREAEPTYNILPNIFDNLSPIDLVQRLGLGPFCEVVDGDHNIFAASRSRGKGTDHVNAPLSKRPWAVYGFQVLGREPDVWCHYLTYVAHFSICYGILPKS